MYNVFWNKVKEKYPVLLEELSQGLNQLYEQTGNELFTNKEFWLCVILVFWRFPMI